jgi:hypothetical protein
MTPLAAATLVLCLAATVAAVVLARRRREHVPVAAYLVAVVALDLCRWGLAMALPEATGPRVGLEAWLRHLDCLAYLGAILALPGLAVVVFCGGRRLRAFAVVWLWLWVWLVADYPELSGPGLLRVYRLIEIAAVLVSGLCLADWLRGPGLVREGLSPRVCCTLALLAGATATVLVPAGSMLGAWPAVVATNALMIAAALVVQLRALMGGQLWA